MEISVSALRDIMNQVRVYVMHAIHLAKLVQQLVRQAVPLVVHPTIELRVEIAVFARLDSCITHPVPFVMLVMKLVSPA